jgi:thymidylate synthase
VIATPYEDLLAKIMREGSPKGDRTGTGTRSLFGQQLRYDLAEGFPLLTTKKVHFKSVAYELLWFLRGDDNIKYLQDNGVTIWDEWVDEDGKIGRAYGPQWRTWSGANGAQLDQIYWAIATLQSNPNSRRNLVTAWNPAEIGNVGLPPCHVMFQLYAVDNRLSLHIYQRSCDMFLGVPFNIASYALLTHMFAAQAGMDVGELVWTGGDCHIYNNHVDQVTEQLSLSREPRPYPRLMLSPGVESIFDYEYGDIQVIGYDPHPAIKAPVAV